MKSKAVAFLGYLFCCVASFSGVNAQSNSRVHSIDLELSVRFATGGSQRSLNATETGKILQFVALQTQRGCVAGTPACRVQSDNVSVVVQTFDLSFAPASNLRTWHIKLLVLMDSTAKVLRVQSSENLGIVEMKKAIDTELPGFSLQDDSPYQVLFHGDPSRVQVCGDSIVQNAEQCDDGNLVDGDGCSTVCILEGDTMCYASLRSSASVLGNKVTWQGDIADGGYLEVLPASEGCVTAQFCDISADMWDPAVWLSAYENNTEPNITLPTAGFYCTSFCRETFLAPKHYEFRDSCKPVPIDECARGTANCAQNAYCEEPADNVGYSCKCNERSFVYWGGGTGCFESGVEIVLRLVGQVYNAENLVTDEANMRAARLKIMRAMLDTTYLRGSTEDLLLEGVYDYPVEDVGGAIVSGGFVGRSLWRIILRIPSNQVDMDAIAMGSIFQDSEYWDAILDDDAIFQINTVPQCNNDRRVTCKSDQDCLGAGLCVPDYPDIRMSIKSEGGATAPLQVKSAGADVLSVDYDMIDQAFKIRLRFDNTVESVINSVFVSHITLPVSTAEMATFNNDEFPCLPMGTGAFQQQRENSGL